MQWLNIKLASKEWVLTYVIENVAHSIWRTPFGDKRIEKHAIQNLRSEVVVHHVLFA